MKVSTKGDYGVRALVELAPDLQAYADAVLAHPAMCDWYAAAADEPWVIDSY